MLSVCSETLKGKGTWSGIDSTSPIFYGNYVIGYINMSWSCICSQPEAAEHTKCRGYFLLNLPLSVENRKRRSFFFFIWWMFYRVACVVVLVVGNDFEDLGSLPGGQDTSVFD